MKLRISFLAAACAVSAGTFAADYSQSMNKLLQAAQDLRESIQAMAQMPAGPQRERALSQSREALLETQRAMLELPPELRQAKPSQAGHDAQALRELMRAADRLRESVQAMASQQPGAARNQAMAQARQALFDTQQAMIALPATGRAAAGGTRTGERAARGASDTQLDIERTFRSLDADRNGRLTPIEASAVDDFVGDKFERADADGDGLLDRTEFRTARGLDEAPGVPGRTHVRYSFEELDRDRDGQLSKTEAAFKPELAANFDYADKNGNGALNQPEFQAAMAMSAEMFGQGERSAHKRRIFRSLDMDGNAVVSRTEAKWRPALAAAFDAIDRNGNGSLDMGEFAEISLDELGEPQGAAAGGTGAKAK